MFKFLLVPISLLLSVAAIGQVKIVVLGSSTAAGTGVSHPDSAWVNRYNNYLKVLNPKNEVINLAKGGYTTFHILPKGTNTPENRPNPDTSRNITMALSHKPDAIIINLPSNDAAKGFSVNEQLANYKTVLTDANAANVPVWIATTQGRNLNPKGLENLCEMRDSTFTHYGEKAINFWLDIGQAKGTLNITYDSGDGIHLNDKGHKILFDRVVSEGIYEHVLDGQ